MDWPITLPQPITVICSFLPDYFYLFVQILALVVWDLEASMLYIWPGQSSSWCFFSLDSSRLKYHEIDSWLMASVRTWAVESAWRRKSRSINLLHHPLDIFSLRKVPFSQATFSVILFTFFFVFPYPNFAASIKCVVKDVSSLASSMVVVQVLFHM